VSSWLNGSKVPSEFGGTKFWLRPVAIADNNGFRPAELNRIHRHVEQHCQFFLTAYREFHGK